MHTHKHRWICTDGVSAARTTVYVRPMIRTRGGLYSTQTHHLARHKTRTDTVGHTVVRPWVGHMRVSKGRKTMGEGERHENSAVTGNPSNKHQRYAGARLDGPICSLQHHAGGNGVVEACLTLGNSTAALASSSSRKGGGRRSGRRRRRALSTGWGTRLRAGTLGVLEPLLLEYRIKDFGCCFTQGPTRGGQGCCLARGPARGARGSARGSARRRSPPGGR